VVAAGGRLEFAFAEAIALAFDEQEINVVGEAIDERGDACGIGKDSVPVFEDAIGGDQNRAAFVATIDDFEEQVSSAGVVRKITKLINAEDLGPGIVWYSPKTGQVNKI